jgi:thiamine biosynthesis lipoprotein
MTETLAANESLPAGWHNHEFRAMGCKMTAWLETADSEAAAASLTRVEAMFAENEQALSRFRSDSELSQLNAHGGQWVFVSDLLWDVLTLGLRMAAITNGRFDPTILRALEQYGYTVTFEQMARSGRSDGARNLPPYIADWMAVELDETRQAIFLPKGIRVDLGGIAKGYTAQQAVNWLRRLGPCLVDAGGDLAAGAAPAGYPGWPVAVSAPWTADDEERADLCQLWLANQALATSGIDYRTWERDGRPTHHLIDPATGAPAATDGLTVTILADDSAQAEAWATATLVAGSEAGMNALLEAELAGLMVTRAGHVLVTPPMHLRLQMLPSH